jgi:predicted component of type VI protein secretion system
MKPRLVTKVDNKLQDDGSQLGVELKFKSTAISNRIGGPAGRTLRKLVELRQISRTFWQRLMATTSSVICSRPCCRAPMIKRS